MRKLRMLDTGKLVTVSNNEAFGLVDSGKATLDLKYRPNKRLEPEDYYSTPKKRYKTR